MPEVCEIVLLSQYLSKYLINKTVIDVKLCEGKYQRNGIDNIDKLNNAVIKSINTKGKFMWIAFSNNMYMMVWFGLTGFFSFKKAAVRVMINTSDGVLYFNDQLNYGNIIVTDDVGELNKKIDSLAPDALTSDMTVDMCVKLYNDFLKNVRDDITVYELLISQDVGEGVLSGLGNYLIAEILYDSKISPKRLLKNISNAEVKRMFTSMRNILKQSYVYNDTKYSKIMSDFVKKHKDDIIKGVYPNYFMDIDINKVNKFQYRVYGLKKDEHDNDVVNEMVAKKRKTYWVPNVQK